MRSVLEVDTKLPQTFNQHLITTIRRQAGWSISYDDHIENRSGDIADQYSDSGMLLQSYSFNQDPSINELNLNLNILAYTIFNVVISSIDNCKFTNINIRRYLWNYYSRSSQGIDHYDVPINEPGNFCSIVYYLNNTDGGTILSNKFYQSQVGKAIVFDSKQIHRGSGPVTAKQRYALNIVFQYDTLEFTNVV